MAKRNQFRAIEKMTDVIRFPGEAWKEIERLRTELRRLSSLIDDSGPLSEATKDLLIADAESEPFFGQE